jgi:DNA-binding beta-propeller fold protein YncE
VLSALAVFLAAATAPLGVFRNTLAHFDRDTLQPVGPQTQVLEPHAPGALSPDGKRLAMGVSASPPPGVRGRIGLWIVDPQTLSVLHAVPTGIAAEQVAFPGVVAALLQNGDLVVVDPKSGRITARRHTRGDGLCSGRPATLRGGAIFGVTARGRASVALVSAAGRVRTIALRLRYRGACGHIGLAVDPSGRRAFATTGDGRVAEIDLSTRHIRYHRTTARGRIAAWVSGAGLAIAGPGLYILNPRTWRTRRWERDARQLVVSGNTVVTAGRGVTAYEPNGHRRFHALGSRAIIWFQATAGRIYADDGHHLNVIDLQGKVTGRLPASNQSFWFRSPAPAAGRSTAAENRQRRTGESPADPRQ